MPMILRLADLRLDGGSQLRVRLDDAAIADYIAVLQSGAELPPVDVIDDNGVYWLANGFHRHEAHRGIGRDEIACEVRTGTRIDAIRFAAKANTRHGVRLTDADKRKKVLFFLDHLDELGVLNNDSDIARACLVSRPIVATVRAEISEKLSCNDSGYAIDDPTQTRIVRRGDQQYPMKIGGMGRAPPEPPEPIDRDIAPNGAPAPENANESKGAKNASGNNLPPGADAGRRDADAAISELLAGFERLSSADQMKFERARRLLPRPVNVGDVLGWTATALDAELLRVADAAFSRIRSASERLRHDETVRAWVEAHERENIAVEGGGR
jgi:hypothetical protein